MHEYRRSLIPGGTYFFTVVTYNRQPILVSDDARAILHAAWNNVRGRYPFVTDAICLLPDHIHCVWSLPEGDANYSIRWGEIKRLFTRKYLRGAKESVPTTTSRAIRGEGPIWQRRFWEHTIRDQEDLNRHIDYIHYNPVKHGLVQAVNDWPWSTFHRFTREGCYPLDWGNEKSIDEIKVRE